MSTRVDLEPWHLSLGELDLWMLADGEMRLDGGAMFGVVPRVLWERVLPPDDRNRVPLAVRCLLVRSGKTHVLVDTGMGEVGDPRFREASGIAQPSGLLAELARIGVGPEEIDVVVNTHLHYDHAGGNVRDLHGEPRPTFPRARYVVSAGHWQEAKEANERNRRSFAAEAFLPLERAGLLELTSDEVDLAPGVRAIPTPGHCHHHRSVVVTSGGRTAAFLGDLVPTAAHAPLPWVMAFDVDPLRSVESRRAIYAEALRDDWLLLLDHDPRLPCGRLERSESTFHILPAS